MAEVDVKLILDVEVTLKLNEREAMALDALAGYGTEAFLKCFYTHMGRAYLQPYERGLISLFAKIRGLERQLPVGEVRKAIAFYEKNRPETNGERWAREEREAARPKVDALGNDPLSKPRARALQARAGGVNGGANG